MWLQPARRAGFYSACVKFCPFALFERYTCVPENPAKQKAVEGKLLVGKCGRGEKKMHVRVKTYSRLRPSVNYGFSGACTHPHQERLSHRGVSGPRASAKQLQRCEQWK